MPERYRMRLFSTNRHAEVVLTGDGDSFVFVSEILPHSATGPMTLWNDSSKAQKIYEDTTAALPIGTRCLIWARASGSQVVSAFRTVNYVVSSSPDALVIRPLINIFAPRVVYDKVSNLLHLWFWANMKWDWDGINFEADKVVDIGYQNFAPFLGIQSSGLQSKPFCKRVMFYSTGILRQGYVEGGFIPGYYGHGSAGLQGLQGCQDFMDDVVPIFACPIAVGNFSTSTMSTANGLIADGWYFNSSFINRGPIGPTGPTGSQGIQGPTGISLGGLQGPQGPQGAKGPTGIQGPTGATGLQGQPGSQGLGGPGGGYGPQGPVGPIGFQGVSGLIGFQGIIGPTGPQGPQGDPPFPWQDSGPTGPMGFTGPSDGFILNVGSPGGFTGPTGSQGTYSAPVCGVGNVPFAMEGGVNPSFVMAYDTQVLALSMASSSVIPAGSSVTFYLWIDGTYSGSSPTGIQLAEGEYQKIFTGIQWDDGTPIEVSAGGSIGGELGFQSFVEVSPEIQVCIFCRRV